MNLEIYQVLFIYVFDCIQIYVLLNLEISNEFEINKHISNSK